MAIGESDVRSDQGYFAVSTTKLVVMSLCTLNIYALYWIYKNWGIIKKRESSKVWPFWRAFFGYFFLSGIMERMNAEAKELGLPGSLSVNAITLGWFLLFFSGRLPAPFWLLTFFTPWVLVPVQTLANQINAQVVPERPKNSRFGAWNITAVILGGGMFILSVMGTFSPSAQ